MCHRPILQAGNGGRAGPGQGGLSLGGRAGTAPYISHPGIWAPHRLRLQGGPVPEVGRTVHFCRSPPALAAPRCHRGRPPEPPDWVQILTNSMTLQKQPHFSTPQTAPVAGTHAAPGSRGRCLEPTLGLEAETPVTKYHLNPHPGKASWWPGPGVPTEAGRGGPQRPKKVQRTDAHGLPPCG